MPLQLSPELLLVTALTVAFPFAFGWVVYRLLRSAVRAGLRDAIGNRETPAR